MGFSSETGEEAATSLGEIGAVEAPLNNNDDEMTVVNVKREE